jgi:hypothetical protein
MDELTEMTSREAWWIRQRLQHHSENVTQQEIVSLYMLDALGPLYPEDDAEQDTSERREVRRAAWDLALRHDAGQRRILRNALAFKKPHLKTIVRDCDRKNLKTFNTLKTFSVRM